ncbi:hypothetical protein LINGRAPRIM_LOCUS605 [Linum grandiflorum]
MPGETIIDDNTTSAQDKAKALIFIRHYLDEGLKMSILLSKILLFCGIISKSDMTTKRQWFFLELAMNGCICAYKISNL